jgi:hypothetical protein
MVNRKSRTAMAVTNWKSGRNMSKKIRKKGKGERRSFLDKLNGVFRNKKKIKYL